MWIVLKSILPDTGDRIGYDHTSKVTTFKSTVSNTGNIKVIAPMCYGAGYGEVYRIYIARYGDRVGTAPCRYFIGDTIIGKGITIGHFFRDGSKIKTVPSRYIIIECAPGNNHVYSSTVGKSISSKGWRGAAR